MRFEDVSFLVNTPQGLRPAGEGASIDVEPGRLVAERRGLPGWAIVAIAATLVGLAFLYLLYLIDKTSHGSEWVSILVMAFAIIAGCGAWAGRRIRREMAADTYRVLLPKEMVLADLQEILADAAPQSGR